MAGLNSPRTLIANLTAESVGSVIVLRGWVLRLRNLAKTTFLLLRDCSGELQCVLDPSLLKDLSLKKEDTIEVIGQLQRDHRAKQGFELLVDRIQVLNPAIHTLPFYSISNAAELGPEILLEYRPLALRTDLYSTIFRIQAALLQSYREYLQRNLFTEVVTSKIVASGTEGGTNLFEIKYFERAAYLAQSPQFYKEECVAGFERVFETGHVYRAEPHASSRHLTEYYSLDLEMGFIDGPEEIIELEKNLLNYIFDQLNSQFSNALQKVRGVPLPSLEHAPIWEFEECLERLQRNFSRTDLIDDLDPQAERQLCSLAEKETGVNAVFVLGFPLSNRPFYTHPRNSKGAAQSFDLLFEGLEITTGGQRLHRRQDLEDALSQRKMDPNQFESHLKMFELGMPPHGGLAIGLERLTAQILKLSNVKEATLYPRDRYRVSP